MNIKTLAVSAALFLAATPAFAGPVYISQLNMSTSPLTTTDFSTMSMSDFGFDQISQLLQAQLKKAGVDVKISAESFPTVAASMNAGKHNLGNFFYFDLDGRDALYATLDSSQVKSGYNWAHYSNPKLDALLAKANNDTAGREQALKDAMKIAMDDAVYIPLYDVRQLWVTNKDVSGVKFGQSGYPLFYTTK